MESGLIELQRQSEAFLKYVLDRMSQCGSNASERSQTLFEPLAFPHPFLRAALRDLNKAHRLMRGGHHGAGRFMRDLKMGLLSWFGAPPPGDPFAISAGTAAWPKETRRAA